MIINIKVGDCLRKCPTTRPVCTDPRSPTYVVPYHQLIRLQYPKRAPSSRDQLLVVGAIYSLVYIA